MKDFASKFSTLDLFDQELWRQQHYYAYQKNKMLQCTKII